MFGIANRSISSSLPLYLKEIEQIEEIDLPRHSTFSSVRFSNSDRTESRTSRGLLIARLLAARRSRSRIGLSGKRRSGRYRAARRYREKLKTYEPRAAYVVNAPCASINFPHRKTPRRVNTDRSCGPPVDYTRTAGGNRLSARS